MAVCQEQPNSRNIKRSKENEKITGKCRRQTTANIRQLAFRGPKLKLFDDLKITKLIKFKYENLEDCTCAKLENMNFANKFEKVIPTIKKKRNIK